MVNRSSVGLFAGVFIRLDSSAIRLAMRHLYRYVTRRVKGGNRQVGALINYPQRLMQQYKSYPIHASAVLSHGTGWDSLRYRFRSKPKGHKRNPTPEKR